MVLKTIAVLVSIALLLAFIGPPVLKLKEFSLTVVVLIGVAMTVIDAWQTLRSDED